MGCTKTSAVPMRCSCISGGEEAMLALLLFVRLLGDSSGALAYALQGFQMAWTWSSFL